MWTKCPLQPLTGTNKTPGVGPRSVSSPHCRTFFHHPWIPNPSCINHPSPHGPQTPLLQNRTPRFCSTWNYSELSAKPPSRGRHRVSKSTRRKRTAGGRTHLSGFEPCSRPGCESCSPSFKSHLGLSSIKYTPLTARLCSKTLKCPAGIRSYCLKNHQLGLGQAHCDEKSSMELLTQAFLRGFSSRRESVSR